MMDPVTRKRLEEKLKVANAEIAELKARLADARPGPGTLLYIPGVDPTWLWAGLSWYRESDDILLCVPADDAPFAGAADYQTDAASWPVTLRCGYGVSITRPLLDKMAVVGEISEECCKAALDRIRDTLNGCLIESLDDADGEEDLEDWYDRLDRVVCNVMVLGDKAEQEAEIHDAESVDPLPANVAALQDPAVSEPMDALNARKKQDTPIPIRPTEPIEGRSIDHHRKGSNAAVRYGHVPVPKVDFVRDSRNSGPFDSKKADDVVETLRTDPAVGWAETALGNKVVLFRTRVQPQQEAWAADGPSIAWGNKVIFDGPGGRVYALEGGVGNREHARSTARLVLREGPDYPVVSFGLGLELADGRIVFALEGDVQDGATITFEGVSDPDEIRGYVFVQPKEE